MSSFCNQCLVETDTRTFRFIEGRVWCRACVAKHEDWKRQMEQLKELSTPKLPRTRFEREDPL